MDLGDTGSSRAHRILSWVLIAQCLALAGCRGGDQPGRSNRTTTAKKSLKQKATESRGPLRGQKKQAPSAVKKTAHPSASDWTVDLDRPLKKRVEAHGEVQGEQAATTQPTSSKTTKSPGDDPFARVDYLHDEVEAAGKTGSALPSALATALLQSRDSAIEVADRSKSKSDPRRWYRVQVTRGRAGDVPWAIACWTVDDGFGWCDLWRKAGREYVEDGLQSDYARGNGVISFGRTYDGRLLALAYSWKRDDACCGGGEADPWVEEVRIYHLAPGARRHLATARIEYSRAEGVNESTRGLGFSPSLQEVRYVLAHRHGAIVRAIRWDGTRFLCHDLRPRRVSLAVDRALAGKPLSAALVHGFSREDLVSVKNAPFARHGRPFRTKKIADFFYESARWDLEPDEGYKRSRLSRIDWENARLAAAQTPATVGDCPPVEAD